MHDVLADAVAIAEAGTIGFGVSIDLDAIDPQDAPAVGSPVKGGIRGADLVDALGTLRDNPRLLAMEIAEYNPFLDPSRATAELLLKIAGAVAAPSSARLAA
jgi:arginase family enzyme